MQSLGNKFEQLYVLVEELAPDIFVISEHWLKKESVELFNTASMTIATSYRRHNNHCGGVAL